VSLRAVPSSEAQAVADVLARRHSCRAFEDRPVPPELIERMLTMAQQTPSWCNVQPWQVVVTSGEGTVRLRNALYAAANGENESDLPRPSSYAGVYLQRRRESGYALYRSVGIAREDREARARQAGENFRLFGAPHAAIVTSAAELGPYGVLDVGAYLGTVAIAAEALGLGLVIQAALAMRASLVRELLSIPEDRVIVAGFSFGWEARDQRINRYRTARAPLEDAVCWFDGGETR